MGYSPILGRFLQRDPVAYDAGSNLYEYVKENPANWTDPSGLVAIPGFPGFGEVSVPATIGIFLGYGGAALIDYLTHLKSPKLVTKGPESCPAGEIRYLRSRDEEMSYATLSTWVRPLWAGYFWFRQVEIFSWLITETYGCCKATNPISMSVVGPFNNIKRQTTATDDVLDGFISHTTSTITIYQYSKIDLWSCDC